MELIEWEQLPLQPVERHIVQSLWQQREEQTLTIGLFGSFSVGKSELLNRLLETDALLPTHTNETTAIPTWITYGERVSIEREMEDGTRETLDEAAFRNYVAGGAVDETDALHVALPGPEWMRRMTFIDTPGRNTKYERHIEASERAIIASDAAIYVMPWQGLTMEDVVYLQKIAMYQPNLYFVVNKIDRIDETQGVSIEEVCEQVSEQLEQQLGRSYPVFAVSAKTGDRLEAFVEQCLLDVASSVDALKEERFMHALQQWAIALQRRLLEDVHLLQVATSADAQHVEAEYRTIEIEREKVQRSVDEQVRRVQSKLRTYEADFKALIQQEVQTLERKLLTLAEQSSQQSEEALNVAVQHELLLTRQRIVASIQKRFEEVVGEHVAFQVESVQGTERTIEPTTYDASDIIALYELETEERARAYAQKTAELEAVMNAPVEVPDHVDELQSELAQLEEEMNVHYVPQMVERVKESSNAVTKTLQAVGFAADVVGSILLAAPTGGGSVAAKLGGKGAAKAGTKLLTKETMKATSKKIAREGAEKLAKRAAQQALPAKDGKANPAANLLTTLDTVTSPFETMAKSIGQAIDGGDQVYHEEDLEYRQQFFSWKANVERSYDERKDQLRDLERAMKDDEAIRQAAQKKLAQLERQQKEEVERKEREWKEKIARESERKKREHVERHIHEMLAEEAEHYELWVGLELDRAAQAAAIAFPKLAHDKLDRWQGELDSVMNAYENGKESVERELEEKERAAETIRLWLKERTHE